jgi:hypothetical protein
MAPKPTCLCGTCRKCIRREKLREYRAQNPEKHRASNRVWRERNAEKVREDKRRWRRENPDRVRESNRNWAQQNPEKRRAHSHVAYAVRAGLIERQPCEVCGGASDAHHDDYSKPLEVRWLCRQHHADTHKATR